MKFWVVGGIYKDTKFKELAKGKRLEKYGPFNKYSEAKKVWDNYSWKKVDDCFFRYTIIQKE